MGYQSKEGGKTVKNGIVINGKSYKAVRTTYIPGLAQSPCTLCDITVKRLCESDDVQPCRLFNRGYKLAHFKLEDKK